MRAGHIKIFANIEPDCFDFLGCHLNIILEAKDVTFIFYWESIDHIVKLDALDVLILLGQNENIAVRVL